MKAILTFLGTASGTPTRARAHTCNLLEFENYSVLIDCGENCQRQLLLADKNCQKIDYILLTHWHIDHMSGLLPLLASMDLNKRENPLFLFCPKPYENFVKEQIAFFNNKFKWFHAKYIEDSGPVFGDDKLEVLCEKVEHSVLAFAYKIKLNFPVKVNVEKLEKIGLARGPKWNKLQSGCDVDCDGKTIKAKDVTFQKPPFSFVFSGDTILCKNFISFAKEADVAVFESTYLKEDCVQSQSKSKKSSDAKEHICQLSNGDVVDDHYHMTADDAATAAKKAKVKQLILTHFSARHPDTLLFENEAKKVFKNTSVAKDLKSVEFNL